MQLERQTNTMITSIVLEWQSCGLCCSEDIICSKTKVFRRNCNITYEEYNGEGNLITSLQGLFTKSEGEQFFLLLEDVNDVITTATDYTVPVCDGSYWLLKLRYSDHTVRKIEGTVEYPPYGREIEQQLLKLCEEAGARDPLLFGCGG